MKKVLLVCNNSWALWHFRKNVINFFLNKKYKVVLVCPFDKNYEKCLTDGITFYDWKLSQEGGRPLEEFKSILQLRSVIKSEKPDFVFNYSIKPSIYGSIARIGFPDLKMVSLITGFGFVFLSNQFKARIGRFLYYTFLRFSDEVWFLNKDDLNFFLEKKCISPRKALKLPGEGVDVNRFSYKPMKHNQVKKILFIGRLLRDKGVLHLTEAAKRINANGPVVEIQILGPSWFENPNSLTKKEFEDLVKNKYVSYLGKTDNVIPFIEDADAVCLPSYREGVPVVLLEAGAMGRVLLASDVPGCREVVVEGVNGILYKSHSTDDLVRAILDFLKISDEKLVEMGMQSRKHVEQNFSTEQVLRRYEEFISKY